MNPELAVEDFKKRIKEYEKQYEPLDDTDQDLSFQSSLRLLIAQLLSN